MIGLPSGSTSSSQMNGIVHASGLYTDVMERVMSKKAINFIFAAVLCTNGVLIFFCEILLIIKVIVAGEREKSLSMPNI